MIPQRRGRGCRKTEITRKHTRGKKRSHTEKWDALLVEQEGRLMYMRDTYKICPVLHSTGDGRDLGKGRVGERVVIAQDAQDE